MTRKGSFRIVFYLLLAGCFYLLARSNNPSNIAIKNGDGPANNKARAVFYNVENLFDIQNDSLTMDGEFTPDGVKHWTWKRLQTKLNHIYKVLLATGDWEPPAIIGLCEIENEHVLKQLVYQSPFSKFNYQYVHSESPDHRGIDVALLYDPGKIKILSSHFVPVKFSSNNNLHTRDILRAMAEIQEDTLHIFVNHWPSRYGGQYKSQHKRMLAARVLRKSLDSLFQMYPRPKIIVMGDFNDGPMDKSIQDTLQAIYPGTETRGELINLSYPIADADTSGTLKYRGQWYIFDQIMVSDYLLEVDQGYSCGLESFSVFQAGFLLEDDVKGYGKKPYRTYVGYKYNNGFSDHLPVILDLEWK